MEILNNSYILTQPEDLLVPLVCDVPHAGRTFPEDFKSKIPHQELRKWEDAYVDELVSHAPNYGIPLLCADVHRTYIDLNRHILDIDPALIQEGLDNLSPKDKTIRTGNGLLKRIGPNGEEIHEGKLSREDIEHRVRSCYVPYHTSLADLLNTAKERFGKVYHLNIHSMFSHSDFWSAGENGTPRADFVLSNNSNETCDPHFTKFVKDSIENMGYTVALNNPFLGGEIICMYGKPDENTHSLQIEIKKSLYMDQFTLEKHKEFKRLQYDISKLLKAIGWWTEQTIGR